VLCTGLPKEAVEAGQVGGNQLAVVPVRSQTAAPVTGAAVPGVANNMVEYKPVAVTVSERYILSLDREKQQICGIIVMPLWLPFG
jgi:hypothetical protein